MATATITSSSSNKSMQSPSFERSATSRDASFSSYLNGSEENFILQIAEESRRLKSFPAIPGNGLNPIQNSKSGYEGEIDVFSADKYFNETVGEMCPNIGNKDDPLDMDSLKQKIRPRTPSVRSESSWNSRSSLLHKQKTDQQLKKTNFTKRFLASIGCRCSCNDEDSVHVDNQNSEGKTKGVTKKGDMNQFKRPNSNTWKEDRLSKNIEGSKYLVADTPDRVHEQGSNPLHNQDECAKTSLEVFGSPIQTRGDKSGKLAWVAAIKKVVETEQISADANLKYNDTDSDASSDLFEIESFSTNTNIKPYLTRQESDGMSAGCVSPTSCYAPSEVSVQWSTVTASMADFSMMSDSEELDIITTTTTNHSIKQTASRRPGILSGCKSYKAVHIAGESVFIQDQKKQQRMETSKPTRFQNEYKLDTTRKDIQHRFTTHSSATESQFKCAPHPMYIH